MNTHDTEPMKYGGTKSDDYVTGWNDCYAAFKWKIMNTHDKYELPTLPEPFTYTRPGKSEGALYHAGHMQDYARAAIEAYRGCRDEPVGEAGSMPGTSGFTMACFPADKVPVGTSLYLDPQPAEPSRGEPVAKVRERGFVVVDGRYVPTVLVEFPIDDWESRDRFADMVCAPQPANPRPSDDELLDQALRERDAASEMADKLANAIAKHLGVEIGEHSSANHPWYRALDAIEASQPVEPVKGPSDDELADIADEVTRQWQDRQRMPLMAWDFRGFLVSGMRALLARYGQPAP